MGGLSCCSLANELSHLGEGLLAVEGEDDVDLLPLLQIRSMLEGPLPRLLLGGLSPGLIRLWLSWCRDLIKRRSGR